MMSAPIVLALDAPDLDTMQAWALAAAPHVSVMKVGLEVFCRDGRAAVEIVRALPTERELFLDLKLHDIPATVGKATAALGDICPEYLTVHASGGPAMVAAAAKAAPRTRITAVTVLTSLSAEDLRVLGVHGSPSSVAVEWARLAVDAGARAIVCSPHEVAEIRAAVGPDVHLITPGVRPAGAAQDDQVRVATPSEAISWGADLVVIGRPITGAADPAEAAAAVAEGISHSVRMSERD
jgi:orotidine-5'-phosphate decarboxylase